MKSKRKTVALQITRDLEVVVRGPQRMAKRDADRFVERHSDWIEANLERQRRWNTAHPEPDDAELARLKEAAQVLLPERVEHYGGVMGLTPASVKITAAKTRFGSCSGKNGLCFSCRLMRYPQEAIDYVVVHELAHIVHKNHGKDFYGLVESVLPDYRQRRALLKKAVD
ncbi:M48 family metallopeptidase [Ruminococcaceae bacterium OttesenSCG-928-L11]|nr:M48 family metallopeptidase [Ruminococcaceae bacterium OttesenSCG-928-L11]